jgi:hypothetical protein
MNVHFAGSKQGIKENIGYYRQIIKAIHNQGHTLTQDWVEPSYELSTSGRKYTELDWNSIYKDNMEALAKADVIIVDITVSNFAVGYMTAIGLQHKKPTLVLFRDNAIEGTMASGMDESLVTLKEYDEKNVEATVADFLQKNNIETKDMRFNFFIDRPIYNYLRWAAYKTGKTKAEILRELVSREIDKDSNINHL